METDVSPSSFNPVDAIRGSELPEPRSGHRIVADEGNLYCIGGYNPGFWEVENDEHTYYPLFRELWKFNFASKKWSKVQTKGYMPKELASHAALLHGHNLVVMGGTGVPFGDTASNKLHVCNLRNMQWRTLDCSGDLPTPSYGHAMVINEDQLYLFGGTTGWQYNADIHQLDLCRQQWTLLEPDGETPDGRYRHEVAYYDNKLYVLGGGRSNASYKFQKIPVFDVEHHIWRNRSCIPDGKHGFPGARRCHGSAQFKDSVYIVGGYNGEKIYGDLWQLNLTTFKWLKFSVVMQEPAYFHATTITDEGCLLIYGGVTKIDDVRTSNIYSTWVQVPSLKEICWNRLTKSVRNLTEIPKEQLFEIGIPPYFLQRLDQD